MMKKLLLTLFVVPFIGMAISLAQPCTPGPQTTPGIYPDSATGLPHAYANVLYETVMTVVVPVDTNIMGFTVPIDSIGIVNFQGLPPGFSYAPNSPSGYWGGGQKGCVLITGQHDVIGEYPLIIEVEGFAAGMGVPWTIDYYKIVIDSTHLSIQKNENAGFQLNQNVPNPFYGTTTISFTTDKNETYSFEVFNMLGELVHSKQVNAVKGQNKIDFNAHALPQGIYFYQIRNGLLTHTKRMIVLGN